MMRRVFFTLFALYLISGSAMAATNCDPMSGVCHHYIPINRLPPVEAQQTMVWCWAATAQTIFRYYGHEVPQSVIVQQALGTPGPVITTGPPDVIIKMLNSSYVDANGVHFTVSTPRYSDTYGIMPGNFAALGMHANLTNSDIFQELSAEHPIFYADGPHAMTLVDAIERGGFPVGGLVLDPAPVAPIGIGPITAPNVPPVGLRPLQPYEMHGFFVAQVVVQ